MHPGSCMSSAIRPSTFSEVTFNPVCPRALLTSFAEILPLPSLSMAAASQTGSNRQICDWGQNKIRLDRIGSDQTGSDCNAQVLRYQSDWRRIQCKPLTINEAGVKWKANLEFWSRNLKSPCNKGASEALLPASLLRRAALVPRSPAGQALAA